MVERPDEPLAARHDLHRPVALLEELDRALDRPRARRSGRPIRRSSSTIRRRAWLTERPASSRIVALRAPRRRRSPSRPRPTGPSSSRRRAEHGAHRQRQFAPPGDVGQVAERAAHHEPGALVGLDQLVRHDGQLTPNSGERTVAPTSSLVARVVGVGQQRDARRHQLRACRFDQRRLSVRPWKRTWCMRTGRSRSSSSACATAVWKSTSQSVGASSW